MRDLKSWAGNLFFVAVLVWIGLSIRDRTDSQQPQLKALIPSTNSVTVTKISDGDTITLADGKRIRFCGIDAPEKSQPLGSESKAYLEKLIRNVNSENLQIDEVERDRYGRSVSEVFIVGDEKSGDKFVNAEMVKAGQAYVYHQYLNNCPNATALKQAEAIAQQQRVGVWSANYQKPWDYRRSKRNN